jgi:hypothetical protein
MRANADRSGRVVLPVLPGRWCVLVLHRQAWQRFELQIADSAQVREVRLQPLPTMAVRVVDADGAPVAGARFRGNSSGWSDVDDPLELVLAEAAFSLANRFLASTRTDAMGYAKLALIPSQNAPQRVHAFHGEQKSTQHPLEAGDNAIEMIVK